MGEKIRVNDPPKKGRKTGKKSPKYLRTVTSKIVPPSTPQKGRFWGLFEQPRGGGTLIVDSAVEGSSKGDPFFTITQ